MADLFDCELGFSASVKDNKASVSVSTEKMVKSVSNSINEVASETVTSAKMVNHLDVCKELRTIVCVPVMKDGKVKNIVGLVNSKQKKFSDQDKELFKAFVKNSKLLN